MSYQLSVPWEVQWWVGRRSYTTSYGSEEAARTVAAALRKQGIRLVAVRAI